MSGIVGWVDFKKDLRTETETASNMSAAIRHRGTKESGFSISPASILIARQNKPMQSGDGKQPMRKTIGGEEYSIVFDGAVFNGGELRARLINKGHSFFGHSDAELVLNAYLEYGAECLNRINGVFALVIYATREKLLFAARDRIGVKPLFYHIYDGGIVLASEIKSLFQNPLCKAEIDNDGLKQIFLLGPGKPMGSGIYRGIQELCQAEYLYFNKNGLSKKKYWKIEAKENHETLVEAGLHTRTLISDAIQFQMNSNETPACLLSGGLDSSIISYVVAQRLKKENRTLCTMSIDYENNEQYFQKTDFQPERDGEYITQMSQFIGSEHETIILKTADVCDALNAAALARGIPGMADIDSSMLVACRSVKKRFGTVFSGECADELFGGYPWYHRDELLHADTFPWSRSLEMRLNLVKNGLLKGDVHAFVDDQYRQTVNSTEYLDTDSPQDRRIRQMFMLNFEWFMQNLLDRTERMGMQVGLDIRVPLCDYRIVEYAYNLPWNIKAANGREKGIMRNAFRGVLPDSIIDRKKSPFPKTFDPIFVTCVKKNVQNMMNDRNSIVRELVDVDYLNKLLSGDLYSADPWYGQLMRLPQVFAYLTQIDCLFQTYSVKLV